MMKMTAKTDGKITKKLGNFSQGLSQTTEGKVKIHYYAGEISRKLRVFYNPEMKLCRDISSLAMQVFSQQAKKPAKRPLVIADILAATGVRGLRYAKEAKGPKKVLLNDLNPSAIKLMAQNIKLNKINKRDVEIFCEDANVFLSRHKYGLDAIDIDPFGSPIEFLDNAARATRNGGLLMITATDTAPLSGTYQKTCIRRYGAKPLRTDIQHEVGVRILAATIARELAKYDKAFFPLLCLAHRHYFRVFGTTKKSKSAASRAIEQIGFVDYCKKCGFRQFSPEKLKICPACRKEMDWAGPLWTGQIFEPRFCNSMHQISSAENGEALKILSTIKEESKVTRKVPAFFYDLHDLCKKYKCKEVPPIEKVIRVLRKNGFKASRTHFSPTAVRTDAPLRKILKIMGAI